MRRTWFYMAPLLMWAAACAPAATIGSSTYYGFSIGVTNAPPPRVVVSRPELVLVPGTSVYVVENVGDDCFQYGGSYYLYSGGFWYRSGSPRGPFVAVDVRRVPRPVLGVPARHWKHHPHGGPPGWTKRGWGGRD